MQVYHVNSGTRLSPASLPVRTLALLIDAGLILVVAAIADYYTISSNEATFLWKPEILIYILLGWLYFAGAESSELKATLGKYLTSIKVTNSYNERVSFKSASIRYFLRPISLVILLLRFVRGLSLTGNRYLHNKLADAYVVREESPTQAS